MVVVGKRRRIFKESLAVRGFGLTRVAGRDLAKCRSKGGMTAKTKVRQAPLP
jgi:hypothetical protein